jgi:plastocyanin domain-containing protein
VIVLALGLIMFNRGLVLTGSGYDFTTLSLRISQEARGLGQSLAHMARLHGDYQTIRTVVGREGFEPSTFILRRGVHVHWIIDVKELTECNRVIVVPKLGLSIELKLGEQTVEFTPGQSGLILWSCWMGMLRGEFQVVDENPPRPNAD